MNKLEPYVEYHGNMLLKNAINSHGTGLKVQFRLREEDDLEIFKGVTKRRKGKAGQVYRMNYKSVGEEHWGVTDIWFLGATWSHNNGAIVAFQLPDVTEWQHFRDWPALSEGKHVEAQEIEVILFMVGDNGELVNVQQRERIEKLHNMKGGPQSIRAARVCSSDEFQQWMALTINDDKNLLLSEQFIEKWIKDVCQIKSRKELDHDSDALDRFNSLVMSPFNRWRGQCS